MVAHIISGFSEPSPSNMRDRASATTLSTPRVCLTNRTNRAPGCRNATRTLYAQCRCATSRNRKGQKTLSLIRAVFPLERSMNPTMIQYGCKGPVDSLLQDRRDSDVTGISSQNAILYRNRVPARQAPGTRPS